jgi:hypothetical protein
MDASCARVCSLQTHRSGWEVILEVNGLLSRSQVARGTKCSTCARIGTVPCSSQDGSSSEGCPDWCRSLVLRLQRLPWNLTDRFAIRASRIATRR